MATASVLVPMLNPSSSNALGHRKDSTLSRRIVLLPELTSCASFIPPYEALDEGTNKDNFDSMLIEKQRTANSVLMGTISRRLKKRKELNNRLITNIMCTLGLIGILLMIIENEITFINLYEKETIYSWFIKLIITITTLILSSLVVYYHYLDLNLYAVNNSLDNCRVGLTRAKLFIILFEVFVCTLHPFPRSFPQHWKIKYENLTIPKPIPLSYISIDVALGLPMFARLYLLCRFIMFHSHLFRDTSSQSLGFLNQVTINFSFLIRAYLDQWPIRTLLTICLFLFFIGSWSLRVCNYNSDFTHLSMLDSMWLFIVTFTTVGYGDLTPSTYCGRSVAALTALIGVLSTALLISVLAQKLLLTRSEKYVHNFALKIQLAKQIKEQAANVIKAALKVWYLKRRRRLTSAQYITAQRRLFRSILINQKLKQGQRQLIDSCVGLPELLTAQRSANDKVEENAQQLTVVQLKIDKIEEKLFNMNQVSMNIQNTLNLLLDKMTQ